MKKYLRIKHRLWILILCIQLVVFAIVYILNKNSEKLIESTDWIIHTQRALRSINEIELRTVDLETGQRGFLITGKENYLDPFNSSIQTIYEKLEDFKLLTSDNPKQTAETEILKGLLDQKIAELLETIQLRREVGYKEAKKVVDSDLGKNLMVEIRQSVERLREEELRLLEIRVIQPDKALEQSKILLYFVLSVNFLFIGLLSFGFLKSITDRIAHIITVIRKISEGQKNLRITGKSWDEMDELALSFNQMLDEIDKSTTSIRQLEEEIASRKRVEEGRKKEKDNQNVFFENIPVGIAKFSSEGTFNEINPEFEKITGYTKDELDGIVFWNLIPQSYKQLKEQQKESLARTGVYGPYQMQLSTKNGKLLPILTSGVKLQDSEGRDFVWSMVQDISEQEDYRNRLQQDIDRFKIALKKGKLTAFEVDLKSNAIALIRDEAEADGTYSGFSKMEKFEDFLTAVEDKYQRILRQKLKQVFYSETMEISYDFQMKHGENYLWYQGHFAVLEYESKAQPSKLFITLRNIEEDVDEEKRSLKIQEKERIRISRDIHDSIGQMLVSIRLMLGSHLKTSNDLKLVDELLNETIKESRMLINNLSISVQESTLNKAFLLLSERMNKTFAGDISLNWTGDENIEDVRVATHIFRIYQEALSNAVKYSKAEKIDITVKTENGFEMEIQDDGAGFDTTKSRHGFGTTNMSERAQEIGAEIKLKSVIGKGTQVRLHELSFSRDQSMNHDDTERR